MFGLISPGMSVSGLKTKFMDMALTNGLMDEDMKDNGTKITCMGTEFTPGKMEDVMKVTMLKTESMVMASMYGLMDESTKANGKTVANMESASILLKETQSHAKDNGKKEKE